LASQELEADFQLISTRGHRRLCIGDQCGRTRW